MYPSTAAGAAAEPSTTATAAAAPGMSQPNNYSAAAGVGVVPVPAPDQLISDTVSESSDSATILSLSRDDLTAIGAGSIREDVRVSRKKLETLILREREEGIGGEQAGASKGFMDSLMDGTNTYIQWPSRMKIGAKTKKDLFVRIYGHNPEDVTEAKQQVLNELGPHRDLRITLKMEISYTDHSHLIGCRGGTIRKVMEDTGCHIHFPDSNRMSKDHKSNQVTIAGGSVESVEQARSRVRELSPLIFQFNLPVIHSQYDFHMNPDAHNIFVDNIQTKYNVQVTIHPPNKLQQTTVSVKGCEVDSLSIKEAIGKIVGYFANGTPVSSITVESTLEISAVQHSFVRAVNDANIHAIMMNTGAKIIFPDLSDSNIQQIKRSRIYIAGEINSVYFARQQLIGCLPLRMIFDLADDYFVEWDDIRQICADLNVHVKLINRNRPQSGVGPSLPPPVPGRSRTLQLIAGERNAGQLFEARRRILGAMEQPVTAKIPSTYALRSVLPGGVFSFGNQLNPPTGPLPSLLIPSSPNMVSPVLSPSFWPPFSPFVSPAISNCMVPGSDRDWKSPEPPMMMPNVPQRHFAPMGFPRFPSEEMARCGVDNANAQVAVTGGRDSRGSNPKTAPNNEESKEFVFHSHRRAPGFERSNTNPSIQVNPPDTTPGASGDGSNNPILEKKLMAMKAMYQAKIGTGPRVPTSEWSGFGFSKTHMNLFPTKDAGNKSEKEGAEESVESKSANWRSTESKLDPNNNPTSEKPISMESRPKSPLGVQKSNPMEHATARPLIESASAKDLPSLFTQNGLEKYIDGFMAEEIDMESFRSLTETDLRSLGVTAYPARKKMLILITQLGQQPLWK